MNYYNEIDPKAAAWLRELIKDGHIARGVVDERSIVDVRPDELMGYTQCHFFAGIGIWSYALRLSGWADDRPVWTGSCPCQPFSSAGRQKGTADERHLWPELRRLISECRPPVVFGEQVASRLGREWLAGVRADLEALGYAVGAADLCAASVGAPHIRQRLYWVAYAESYRAGNDEQERKWWPATVPLAHGKDGGLADSEGDGLARGQAARERWAGTAHDGRLVNADGDGPQGRDSSLRHGFSTSVLPDRVEHSLRDGRQESRDGQSCGGEARGDRETVEPVHAGWNGASFIMCRDGKARRIGPGIQPLAHGVSARVGRLRGYGNAIVPQVASEFVRAFMDTLDTAGRESRQSNEVGR